MTVVEASRAKPRKERRDAIAQEAVKVLVEEGMRGLTHRRLDRRLGYPEGSVSVLFRRRADLVVAAARELARLDFLDFQQSYKPATDLVEQGQPVPLSLFAECQYQQWLTFSAPDKRDRILARFELLLEARRNAEFRAAQRALLTSAELLFNSLMRAIGARYPELARIEGGNFVRGDMVAHHLSQHRLMDSRITVAYFEERFGQIIATTNKLTPAQASKLLLQSISGEAPSSRVD